MQRRTATLAALLASWSIQAGAQRATPPALAPALPRPGAVQILDNARGAVWDVIYPLGLSTGMHRHQTDVVGVELVSATVSLTGPDLTTRVVEAPRGKMYMRRLD